MRFPTNAVHPLIRRYLRSRLRPKPLVFWLTATFLVVAFTFFITFLVSREAGATTMAAARNAMMPMIIIQGIIMMLLATGTVASGITQERLDSVIDYQRMTPMSPVSKILGYLFGLPVREYLMFAVTLPFVLFCIIAGKIPIASWLPFYLIFLTSVTLYHMTGFAAAMISKRWRKAARIAQGLVLVLYIFLPQLSHLGIVFFEFLTVRPAVARFIFPLLTNNHSRQSDWGSGDVPFFHLEISGAVFALLLQLALILLFGHMVARKWKDDNAPALGKPSGTITLVAALVLTMGNLWPNISSPHMPIAKPATVMLMVTGTPALFTLFGLVLALWIIRVISPERLDYRRGRLRCRKFGWPRLAAHEDNASARPFAIGYAALVGGGILLIQSILRRSEFAGLFPDALPAFWMLPLTAAIILLYYHGTREYLGRKTQLMVGLLVWITPILLAIILTAASQELRHVAYFVMAVSPWGLLMLTSAMPFILSGDLANNPQIEIDFNSIRHAASFGLILIAGLAGWFQVKLWRWQRDVDEELRS